MPTYIMTAEACVSFHVEADDEEQAFERASAIEDTDFGEIVCKVSPHISSAYLKTYGDGLEMIEEADA